MIELIAHLWGDYVIGQNHWMANRKTDAGWLSWLACGLHALGYTFPFLLLIWFTVGLGGSAWQGLLVIGASHLIIDRFNLARWWCEFWGTGVPGWLPLQIERLLFRDRGEMTIGSGVMYQPGDRLQISGESEGGTHQRTIVQVEHEGGGTTLRLTRMAGPAPAHLRDWLRIIVDNTMHLGINHVVLLWLGVSL